VLTFRAEHPAVDDESVFVAAELRKADRAVLAFEGIVFWDTASGEGRAECGDMLDMAAEFDLLGKEGVAGLAVFGALVGEVRFVHCGEFCCGCEDGVVGHSVLLDDTRYATLIASGRVLAGKHVIPSWPPCSHYRAGVVTRRAGISSRLRPNKAGGTPAASLQSSVNWPR
jgi:hypothetical protein